ncbi:MAG: TolC family protein [Candidatus Omnitrophica bacterium]|nr:TolC family protein [Candidatus Omnitrophota bacterium]MDD5352268.1 TolC family protein [Candidatus Omnitrophota bacterium]MDD5549866.1 TolC family protein [Candidatus Omnitrophota bacterium]
MKLKRTIVISTLLTFILTLSVWAQDISLTLGEALSIGLRDNHDILLKQDDVKKAKAKIKEAESGLLPTLTFSAGVNKSRGYLTKDLTQTTTQTTLKQYLYKGGKTINTIKKNEYDMEVSEAILDETKLDVISGIEKAFYTLLLAKEYSQLNKGIVENIQEHLDSLKERYRDGLVSGSDILNIESSLENAKEAYENSLNQLEASRALLNNLLYLDNDTKISANAEFAYDTNDIAYEESLLEAIKNRPEIKQYEAQIKSDKKNVEITKADNRPSIYASWDYYSRSHAVTGTNRNWNDYNIIGLTLSWPVFDGWLTKAKVEQAIIDLKETQIMKEKTVKDIALELKNAYLSLKDAIAKIKSSDSDIKVYDDNLSTVSEKYKSGLSSFIDVDDASLKYDVAMFNKKQAIYDHIIAKIDFEKATGGLR